MPQIEVRHLQKTYTNDTIATPAIRDVSFDIHKGEFVAIMGPSGSGKSTLLHILGFLDRPSGGSFCFEGKTMDDYNAEEIAQVRNKHMGFVFQAFNLLPRTSVLENVKLPLLYSDVPARDREGRVREAIEAVGLSPRLHHESSQLSGGEKQRVAIARALVNRPHVIFADEPTGNLDSVSGQTIMDILQRLNEREGHTIVLITHETYTAEHAGRILRLRDGALESDTVVQNRRVAHEHFLK